MLPLRIAIRFISSKKFQSSLIIIGFAIGISTNVFIGNLISSIEEDLIDRTINSQPHITIKNINGGYLEDPKVLLPYLNENENVKVYAKILNGRAFIVNVNEEAPDDIIINGMSSLDDAVSIYDLTDSDFLGTIPQEANQVLIGHTLANNLGLSVGSMLNISISPMIPLGRILYVSGIYETGQSAIDEFWIIGEIIMAGMVLFAIDRVSSIAIQLHDHMIADKIVEDLKLQMNRNDLSIISWMDENQALLSTLRAQSISTKLVQFFILTSVSIAIGAMLNINVVNKQKDIGILKAMGLSDRESAKIFLIQGGLISLLGAIIGLLIGLMLILLFNLLGNEDIVTIKIQSFFTLISIIIAISFGVVASLLPSKLSGRLTIIEIIRGD